MCLPWENRNVHSQGWAAIALACVFITLLEPCFLKPGLPISTWRTIELMSHRVSQCSCILDFTMCSKLWKLEGSIFPVPHYTDEAYLLERKSANEEIFLGCIMLFWETTLALLGRRSVKLKATASAHGAGRYSSVFCLSMELCVYCSLHLHVHRCFAWHFAHILWVCKRPPWYLRRSDAIWDSVSELACVNSAGVSECRTCLDTALFVIFISTPHAFRSFMVKPERLCFQLSDSITELWNLEWFGVLL